ncbi:unnamed protein product, partial [Heligmosomoides polygyrus]|uniref:Tyrosine-protein phosphatase domain-containing protein n=1 Tax=Heligmosomoides polygyrus TaxID=6339 RepID=A0A183GLJ2_HELPZ
FTSRVPSKKLGEGVLEAYKEFLKESPTFFAYWKAENMAKNLKQNGQYILAQAPFNSATQIDFFRMLSQTHPEAMVVMDAPDSEDMKYVFADNGTYGSVSMSMENGDDHEGVTVRIFTVNKSKFKAYCINGWKTDKDPPKDLVVVHEKIRSTIGNNNTNLLLLVCKDGCSRCPLFCLLDIESERIRSKGRMKFGDTIRNIRYQRSNSFDTPELFEVATSAIVELAKKNIDAGAKSEIKTV